MQTVIGYTINIRFYNITYYYISDVSENMPSQT